MDRSFKKFKDIKCNHQFTARFLLIVFIVKSMTVFTWLSYAFDFLE